MLFTRPVSMQDHDELLLLAREAGIGFTSLPADPEVLEAKINRSMNSFAANPGGDRDKRFLFVLEDSDTGKLVGSVGLIAHVGITSPFYSYKLSTIVQASEEAEIYSLQKVLHMVNDYTDVTEVGSLFLLPEYRRDGIGKFLARSRYLMMAEFPDIFSDIVIAEIRGVQDEHGDSPFYKNLAQHFFQMDFKAADFISATKGSQFISDLMPKYPIYVNLLAKEAQEVIGKPFRASLPAMRMLEHEGFRYQGYIDVFDAGPTMEVKRKQIKTITQSKRAKVLAVDAKTEGTEHIVSNALINDFRMAYTTLQVEEGGVRINKRTAESLRLSVGDEVRYVEAR